MTSSPQAATAKPLQQLELAFLRADRGHKLAAFNAILLHAVKRYAEHGDVSAANQIVPLANKVAHNADARASLFRYVAQRAGLHYDESRGQFVSKSKRDRPPWTQQLEEAMRAQPWQPPPAARKPPAQLDVNQEMRRCLGKLEEALRDPLQTVRHQGLLRLIREALEKYATTDAFAAEEWPNAASGSRGRTVFDGSVQQSTMRASKHAKERPPAQLPYGEAPGTNK